MIGRLHDDDGFTLVELLVGMVIMLIVVSATLTVFEGMQRTSRRSQMQNAAQDQARTSLDRLARELRNQATPTNTIPLAIEKATGQDMVLIDVASAKPAGSTNSRNIARVRYCLNTTTRTLWQQRQTWTTGAAPAAPSTSSCPGTTGWTTTTALTDHVSNGDARPVFRPYVGSADYVAGTPTDAITSIDAQLWVDAEPANAPAETRLSTRVTLRNQNRVPVAAFVPKPIGDGHVLLVGTGSSDPEGQSLTYTWTLNGATVATCSTATCDLRTGAGTQTLGLTVTDPSGLSTSAPDQTITVT